MQTSLECVILKAVGVVAGYLTAPAGIHNKKQVSAKTVMITDLAQAVQQIKDEYPNGILVYGLVLNPAPLAHYIMDYETMQLVPTVPRFSEPFWKLRFAPVEV